MKIIKTLMSAVIIMVAMLIIIIIALLPNIDNIIAIICILMAIKVTIKAVGDRRKSKRRHPRTGSRM